MRAAYHLRAWQNKRGVAKIIIGGEGKLGVGGINGVAKAKATPQREIKWRRK